MAAAAWHAEPLLRFLSTALGVRVAGVQLSTVPGSAGVSQVAYDWTVWDGSGPTSNGSVKRGWNRGRTRRSLAEIPMNPGGYRCIRAVAAANTPTNGMGIEKIQRVLL